MRSATLKTTGVLRRGGIGLAFAASITGCGGTSPPAQVVALAVLAVAAAAEALPPQALRLEEEEEVLLYRSPALAQDVPTLPWWQAFLILALETRSDVQSLSPLPVRQGQHFRKATALE